MRGEWTIPFRNMSFTWFFLGQAVSAFGDWCSYVIIPVLVYNLSQDAASVGILMICRVLPGILLTPVIARVLGKRSLLPVMIVSDLVRGFGYLAFLFVKTPLEIYLLSVVLAVGTAFFNPGRYSLIPSLVPEQGLARANSYMGGVAQLAMLVGPAIGGMVFGVTGMKAGLIFNAMTFFFSMVSLLLVRLPKKEQAGGAEPTSMQEQVDKKESSWARFIRTMRALRERKLLFLLLLVGAACNMGFGGALAPVFPVLAKDVFHNEQTMYGWLMSLLGGGIFFGMMVAPNLQKKLPRFPLISVTMAVGGVFVNWFGHTQQAVLACVVVFLLGLLNGVQDNAETTYYQVETQERGDTADVFSLSQMFYSTYFILATLVSSVLTAKWGAPFTVKLLSYIPMLIGAFLTGVYFLEKKEGKIVRVANNEGESI